MSDTASQHHIEIDIDEADSKNNDTNAGNENPPSPLSTDVSSPDDAVDSESSSSSSSPPPLYQSSRLKGYITLLISAVYNYIALADINDAYEAEKNASNLCLYIEDLSRFANNIPTEMQSRIRYAKSSALITLIVTGFVISVHLDVCTGLEKKVWKMMFGRNCRGELFILTFLTIMWVLTTWFNTTIRGVAGDGKEEFNLYFSTWICLWSSFWSLERWCTASGRASFERFVSSWPNRGPMWIIMFLLSLSDFLFVLDLYSNWPEGTQDYLFAAKIYSDVNKAEWVLLLFVSSVTFTVSLAWALAEIFRESRTNKESLKSGTENYIEGFMLHILTVIWVTTVCIVTMPGGSASLLGNCYFTTWGTVFSCVGTLVWWLRDWRQEIFDVIQKQQEEYDLAKTAVRKREEKKMAKRMREVGTGESAVTNAAVVDGVTCRWRSPLGSPRLEPIREHDGRKNVRKSGDDFNEEDDIFSASTEVIDKMDSIVEDDMTTSVESTVNPRPRLDSESSSVNTTTSPESGAVCSSRSLYVSAQSSLPPDLDDT